MNPHAKALGKLGGKVKSEAKAAAARENGKKGGRPRSEVAALADREGISRQAAWYRLRKASKRKTNRLTV